MIVLDAKTKSKRPRTVPLIKELHPIMDRVPLQIDEHALRKQFRKARHAAGLPTARFHDLRHTFASWLAPNPDVPVTVLRDLMGHSTLAMTGRYSHLRTEALEAAIGRLKCFSREKWSRSGRSG